MSANFVYEIMVRESFLDTFGHVNNAIYLQIFEDARWEFISQNGYTLDYVKKTQKGPIILELQMKFFKEIHLREKIKITCELLEYPKKIGFLLQRIFKENGDLASEAKFTIGLFDLIQRKLIPPTAEWINAINYRPIHSQFTK
jgi:acyl-CoA thioester hydrolase